MQQFDITEITAIPEDKSNPDSVRQAFETTAENARTRAAKLHADADGLNQQASQLATKEGMDDSVQQLRAEAASRQEDGDVMSGIAASYSEAASRVGQRIA